MNETTLPSWWTEEDDQVLIEGKKEGLTYQEIAEELGGRTTKAVRGRWTRIKEDIGNDVLMNMPSVNPVTCAYCQYNRLCKLDSDQAETDIYKQHHYDVKEDE